MKSHDDQVIENARRPLLESIKDLETQVRVLREEKQQARYALATLKGMVVGMACPPMDQEHAENLVEILGTNDTSVSASALIELVSNIMRARRQR